MMKTTVTQIMLSDPSNGWADIFISAPEEPGENSYVWISQDGAEVGIHPDDIPAFCAELMAFATPAKAEGQP